MAVLKGKKEEGTFSSIPRRKKYKGKAKIENLTCYSNFPMAF
jgi:hypothetical protein